MTQKSDQPHIVDETTIVEEQNGDLTKKLVAAAVAFGFAAIAAASAAFAQSKKKTRTIEKVEVVPITDEVAKKTTTKTKKSE